MQQNNKWHPVPLPPDSMSTSYALNISTGVLIHTESEERPYHFNTIFVPGEKYDSHHQKFAAISARSSQTTPPSY